MNHSYGMMSHFMSLTTLSASHQRPPVVKTRPGRVGQMYWNWTLLLLEYVTDWMWPWHDLLNLCIGADKWKLSFGSEKKMNDQKLYLAFSFWHPKVSIQGLCKGPSPLQSWSPGLFSSRFTRTRFHHDTISHHLSWLTSLYFKTVSVKARQTLQLPQKASD